VAGTPRPLSPDEAESRLRAQFGDDIAEFVEQHGHAVATVSVDRYREVCRFLRDEPDFACDYCDFTGGVDFGEEGGFEVITHLFSTSHHHNVRVKVRLPHEEPVCPTLSDLFAASNWHERETSEMFGISFEGHPQPVKLLLSEPFEGYPLRKDFELMSREAKPWPGAVEGEEEEEE
jgi:NADH-quinone oxidoreductase subunit C